MQRIIVVGGGAMGAGIAFVAAHAGFTVDLIEPDVAAQERARQRIAADAERAKMPEAGKRVTLYAEIPDGPVADFAIEAVPERLDLKREIFRNLAEKLGPRALLATNTSSFSVAKIAEGIDRPERAIGLHFFNPPAAMKLVEIVVAPKTSAETIERARSFVERIRKISVLTTDTPGFIVNRVARPYYLQAMRAYEAGVASIEDLDRLARGIGFRMGPFELMDLIGIDVNLATSESVYEQTGAERLKPVNIQREMVAKNRLGRKTQAGFYDYPQETRGRDASLPSATLQTISGQRIAILGTAALASELANSLQTACVNDIPPGTTIVIDTGDGAQDRSSTIKNLDSSLPENVVILSDAYATDLAAAARRMKFPQRLVGYGILGSLEQQQVVEIVNPLKSNTSALESAGALFASLGRSIVLVKDHAGLFLGRTVASIVNEAAYAIDEKVASPEDIDRAMQLGTNYPLGPTAWGESIGAARVRRILERLVDAEGASFAPHAAVEKMP